MGRIGQTKEEKDIMCGGGGGDWVMWRSKGRGEEVLLTSLKGMLKFWEGIRLKKVQPHVMVSLYMRFKGETGENWHMVPLVYEKKLRH